MPTPFIHLHAHSHYSFLRGLASPQALAQAAAEAGLSALALADHHGLTGAIEFYDACREASARLEQLLDGPFSEKSLSAVVQNKRAKLAEWQATRAKLEGAAQP